MDHERRKHPRLEFELPLDITSGHSLFAARTADISEGGVFIKTRARVARGAHVRMRLRLDGTTLVVRGQVTWVLDGSEGRHGIGVQFVGLSPYAQRTLRRFMRDHAPDLYAPRPAPVLKPPRPRRRTLEQHRVCA